MGGGIPTKNKICSIVYRHGCPKRILSDQGGEFVNEVCELFKYYCSKYNSGIIPFCLYLFSVTLVFQLNNCLCSLLCIERSVTAAYHPQINDLDEKTNDNIKRQAFRITCDRLVSLSYL